MRFTDIIGGRRKFAVLILVAALLTAPLMLCGGRAVSAAAEAKETQAESSEKKEEPAKLKTAEDIAKDVDEMNEEESGSQTVETEPVRAEVAPVEEPELLPATAAKPVPPPKPKPKPAPATKPAEKLKPKEEKPTVSDTAKKLKKGSPSQVDFESEEKEEEKKPEPGAEEKKPDRLQKLPAATSGRIEYFEANLPQEPVVDMAVIALDTEGTPGLAVLSTGALDVYAFETASRLKRVWHGSFKEKYPRRGFAGTLNTGSYGGKQLLFVSTNTFKKAFAFEWNDGRMAKAGRTSSVVVSSQESPALNIVSEFGHGVTSFSGSATKIVDTSGAEPKSKNFPIPADYYSGCVMRWSEVSMNLVQMAVATEYGALRIYQGGTLKAETEPKYGGAVVCVPKTAESNWLVATDRSGDQDAVIALEFRDGEIEEVWRTSQLSGAIASLIPCDLDGDGVEEVMGILSKRSGGKVLFRLLPVYKPAKKESDEKKAPSADKAKQIKNAVKNGDKTNSAGKETKPKSAETKKKDGI